MKRPQWTITTDKYPEDGVIVLLITRDRELLSGYHDSCDRHWRVLDGNIFCTAEEEEITKWAPFIYV